MKLRYSQTALRQIEKALDYIAVHSPQGARDIRDTIMNATMILREHPYLGQATSRPETRRIVLTPYPYVIFYRVAVNEIVVTRFRHAARKPYLVPKR